MIQERDDVAENEPLRILVVDDEPHILDFLRLGLTYERFDVATAEDGETALQEVARFKPHLVILDLMLPGIDGMELASRLRRDPDLLLIMLTAKDQVTDRVAGLTAGADDYIVKPFAFEELLARIQAVTRRRLPAHNDILRVGSISMDQGQHVVSRNGSVIGLRPKEYDLLRLFLQNPKRVLPRQMILDRIWGYDFYGDENNVEVYIGYLRRKLGDDDRQLIETVRGVGYRLKA
jgi:two-component system, OmpR family, response regulator